MGEFNAHTPGNEVVEAFASEARGKTVVITGPSESSLGAQTALFLAPASPKLIILAGRTLSKIQPVIDQIKEINPDVAVEFIKLDLASQASVRKAAKEISARVDKVDILINNAGVMAVRNYTTTAEGIELQFGINHIGHFLLTNLLVDKIFAAGKGARILNVTSMGHMTSSVRFDDWNFKDGTDYNSWRAYGQSKSANILFSTDLAKKLQGRGVLVFPVTPPIVIDTKLQEDITREEFAEGFKVATEAMNGDPFPPIPETTLAAGASSILYAALNPSLTAHSGAFVGEVTILPDSYVRPHAKGKDNEDRLWSLSEKLVGQNFNYA